jgi:hypothetical protein
MKIIAAYDRNHEDLTKEQIEADMPELVKKHEEALASEPTWKFFGGIITINGHEYQVAP